LRQFFAAQTRDPRARGLSVDAFLLAPVQRIARYPLLVAAIVDCLAAVHPYHASNQHALQVMTDAVGACNSHLRKVGDYQALASLAQSLDLRRVPHTQSIEARWATSTCGWSPNYVCAK
jgi:hypothetical protein